MSETKTASRRHRLREQLSIESAVKKTARRADGKMRVAAVQMKFASSIEGNLELIERFVRESTRRRADTVLFPECAVTGYAYDFQTLESKQIRAALQSIGDMAAKWKINLLVGTPVFRRRRLCNCLVVFNRRGRITCCYAKNQLTPSDQKYFVSGNAIALFKIDGITCTAIICHERRYPELVRLAVMGGAQILFHPNAGMDSLAVSRKKRDGQDGIVARAFENAIYYVFANSVGRQAGAKWSAGDSKIVSPDGRFLKIADNENEGVIVADLDLAKATRSYAQRSMQKPEFLTSHWKTMVREVCRRAAESALDFDV